jgi:uncharacterized membrane protein YfcA
MKRYKRTGAAIAGAAAGAVNALFGAGGGMILVPLLSHLTDLEEEEIFPCSICVILPICLISLGFLNAQHGLPWKEALPYLVGSSAGGILAGLLGKRIPMVWLHRVLGLFIIWGGFRYLC